MKKFFLFIFFIVFAGFSFAQINFTANDLNNMYSVGSTTLNVSTGRILNVSMDIGTASNSAQNWVLPSNLTYTDTMKMIHIPFVGSPFENNFPGATNCMKIDFTNENFTVYNYIKIASDHMANVGRGIIASDTVAAIDAVSDTMTILPVELGTNFQLKSTEDLGNGLINMMTGTTTYDGYGTISTPYGNFQCLRSIEETKSEIYLNGDLHSTGIEKQVIFMSKQARIEMDIESASTSGVVNINNVQIELFNATTNVENENYFVKDFAINQNYPNPFNPSTTINYQIPVSGNVELKVFDILGNEVATLVNQIQNAGTHSVNFDASNLSSGTYIYTIKSGSFFKSNKMMLVK